MNKIVLRSITPASTPYLKEWTEVSNMLAIGLIGEHERKEVPDDWEGPSLSTMPQWAIGDKDIAFAESLLSELTRDLNTSDLNVCYTGSLKEETDMTAVALAITTLKSFAPNTNEWNNEPYSAVLRYLRSKETYVILEDTIIPKPYINLEIERKFVLKSLPFIVPEYVIKIEQYYHPDRFRIRKSIKTYSTDYVFCEKEATEVAGIFKEKERDLTAAEFDKYLINCNKVIRKLRYVYLREDGLKWEVDVYEDVDKPDDGTAIETIGRLITAEIELPDIVHEFKTEAWMTAYIDKEVTGLSEYFNSHIALPYTYPIVNIY